jgi:ankyrin repeat protein
LVREGANPNLLLKRKGGLSPFHLSVGLSGSKALEIVAVLLDGNANPNNRAFDGLTPLHIAGILIYGFIIAGTASIALQ